MSRLNARTSQDDGFVVRINANNTLAWSRYVGGTAYDTVSSVALVTGIGLVAAGRTSSPNVNPNGPVVNGGLFDAFLQYLSSSGAYVQSQHLGGPVGGASGDDFATGVASARIPILGTVKVVTVGTTNSPNFITDIGGSPSGNQIDSFIRIEPRP